MSKKEEKEKKLISEAMSLLGKKSKGVKKNVDPELAKERAKKAGQASVEARRKKKESKD